MSEREFIKKLVRAYNDDNMGGITALMKIPNAWDMVEKYYVELDTLGIDCAWDAESGKAPMVVRIHTRLWGVGRASRGFKNYDNRLPYYDWEDKAAADMSKALGQEILKDLKAMHGV